MTTPTTPPASEGQMPKQEKNSMKLAKASQREIDELMRWLQARENSPLEKDTPPAFMRIVFGYETLVENCCDPDKDYLEWKPGQSPKDFATLAAENKRLLTEHRRLRVALSKATGDLIGWVESTQSKSVGEIIQEMQNVLTSLPARALSAPETEGREISR